ncbi:hypothetical protein ACLMJK_009388 [Lecanora helva]
MNGYHFGVLCCAWTSGLVLLLNITATIWAATTWSTEGGIGTLQKGNCKHSSNLGFWIHLMINILSTALLGASNYTMQCLASPTRSEIDKAHQRGSSVDIGLPSVRNFWSIARHRKVLWGLLALTTVPLHLLWNSAVFVSLATRDYSAYVVPNDFPQHYTFASADTYGVMAGPYSNSSSAYNATPTGVLNNFNESSQYWSANISNTTSNEFPVADDIGLSQIPNISRTFLSPGSRFEYLSVQDCLRKYIGPIISDRADVLLVSSQNYTFSPENDNGTGGTGGTDTQFSINFPYYDQVYDGGAGQWICSSDQAVGDHSVCDLQRAAQKPNSTVISAWDIHYCWSRLEEEHCQLQYSLLIMIVVSICNAVKLGCMVRIAWRQDSEPLITLGDALVSFLNLPDKTTSGRCLASTDHLNNRKVPISSQYSGESTRAKISIESRGPDFDSMEMEWLPERRFYFGSARKGIWVSCICLCLACLTITSALLGKGLQNFNIVDKSLHGLWTLGFGTVTPQSTIAPIKFKGSWGLLLTVLVSNLPQVLLSLVYLSYNNLFTSMLLAQEWNGYASHRKTLRVTSPFGEQRSTYWLQLPYRYSVPLLIASAALHWLLSQSVFLARVIVLDDMDAEVPDETVSTCGYSNIAIIFVIGLGSLLVLILLGFGFRQYKAIMPLARSCSFTISAACHPPELDTDAALKPVKWGAVEGSGFDDGANQIGHCAFTSFEVLKPVEGRLYA